MRDQEGWYHSWPLTDVKVKVHDPLAAHRQLLKTITNADIQNLFAYLETLN
jgi:cytochrome c oxidase cbb3-type subunit 3